MTIRLRAALALLLATAAGPALADSYAAVSNTAMSITGDIEFDDSGIVFSNGASIDFNDLVADSFVVDGKRVPASVYSLAEPADPGLLNGNTLCGNGTGVTYVASWAGEGDLTEVAFFDTADAPTSSDQMCASYTYE